MIITVSASKNINVKARKYRAVALVKWVLYLSYAAVYEIKTDLTVYRR